MNEDMNTIDLSEPIADLCILLGVEPDHVAQLGIKHNRAVATLYAVTDEGTKYIDHERNAPATYVRAWKIKS